MLQAAARVSGCWHLDLCRIFLTWLTEKGSPFQRWAPYSRDGLLIPKKGSSFQRWAPHSGDGVFITEVAFSITGMKKVSSQGTRVPELFDLELLGQLYLLE